MAPRASHKRTNGFTIVELLIVIVVIGILAAISLVAYGNVQSRAEAAKTTSAINAYKKALMMYKADTGAYPTTGAFCLGDQYGTFSGQATPSCRLSTSLISVGGGGAARELLKPYLGGQLPMPSTKIIMSGTTEAVGGHFYGSGYSYTLDGEPVVTIEYFIKGGTCPVGPVYTATASSFTSPSVDRSGGMSNGDSRCMLLLRDS